MAGIRIESYLREDEFFSTMAEDVRAGLTASPKRLKPKYFYDAEGSRLFEEITVLPEYYPTRTEAALLESIAPQLLRTLHPAEIVELGSGSSVKANIVLGAQGEDVHVQRYVPFDVSESIVREAAEALQRRYPTVDIHGVIGDFERHLDKIPPRIGRRLVLFLGSTIGNLDPEERVHLLRSIRGLLTGDDRLLLGIDLIKDVSVLEPAYNDSAGVTAAFNLNMLSVINRGLNADFLPARFRHFARFNPDFARIEMHLESLQPQTVTLKDLGMSVEFAAGETIWTESSHKFSRESASRMLAGAGMRLDTWYCDDKEYFGLALAALA